MTDWIETAAELSVVLGFIGGILGAIFNYVVIKPLKTSIDALSAAVDKLADDFKDNRQRIHTLEGAVERIEKAVVTAHARIDKILHREE